MKGGLLPSTQESLTRLGGVQKAYRCGQPPKKVGAGRCRFCFSYMKDCTRNKCPPAPHALELVERSEAKTVANVFDSGVRAHTHIISPMMFQRKPNQVWHLRPMSSAKHTRELDSTGWGPESIQVWATTKTAKAKTPRAPDGPDPSGTKAGQQLIQSLLLSAYHSPPATHHNNDAPPRNC